MRRLLGLLVVTALMVSCGSETDNRPTITEARMGQPTGANGAAYFIVHGYGQPDRLTAATTDAAGSVEIHETRIDSDGRATMQMVASLELPPGGTLVLEPGGLHLMLIDVDRLNVGDVASVTLVWERAGEMLIDVTIVDPADTIIDHNHD